MMDRIKQYHVVDLKERTSLMYKKNERNCLPEDSDDYETTGMLVKCY